MMARKNREAWPDRVKLLACILVVLGHFFQSMVTSGFLPGGWLYTWFDKTIYYFHVPLFFVCSGYLYQKTARVNTFSSWKSNVIKKAVVLGIPYVVFTVVTWGLKTLFSGAVNYENAGLLETLLFVPTSPYWYLYALFFIFVMTPTGRDTRMADWMLFAAVIMKLMSIFLPDSSVYVVDTVLDNEIWFVSGIVLCAHGYPERMRTIQWKKVGLATALIFVIFSVLVFKYDTILPLISFVMGCLGCAAVIIIIISFSLREIGYDWEHWMTQATMPIFVMHTIFAAGLRTFFLKLGVTNQVVHVICGLTISFIGPIFAIKIMEKLKLDIVVYPEKYLKLFVRKRKENHD